MKQLISISLGPKSGDYEFNTEVMGQDSNIKRFGTDGDLDKVAEMLLKWANTSGPDSCARKPKPFDSLNHLTVPVVLDTINPW